MSKFELTELSRHDTIDRKLWLDFLSHSINGTIFHSPQFLDYHQNTFQEHHLCILKKGQAFSILPMALREIDGKLQALSPYGASFGSALFKKSINYSDSKELIEHLLDYLSSKNISEFKITPPNPVYFLEHSESFELALLNSGFRLSNLDISNIIGISSSSNGYITYKQKLKDLERKSRKSTDLGVSINLNGTLEEFWPVLMKTFQKHDTKPTHSKEELKHLIDLLPTKTSFPLAKLDSKIIAGLFCIDVNPKVVMTFYICSDPEFNQTQAQTLLISSVVKAACDKGFSYLDLGTSSVNMKPRENIFKFKESLGAVGSFRKTYIREL